MTDEEYNLAILHALIDALEELIDNDPDDDLPNAAALSA